MIQNLIFGILFLKYYFQYTSGHDQNFFFNFIFSSRKSQSQQKLVKKITHFTIQFRLKILVHFMNLNLDLNDIENNTLPQRSQKLFSLYKFSRKYVSALSQKKDLQILCSAISWRPRTALLKHIERKCLHISINLCKKLFVPEKQYDFIQWERIGSGDD